MPLDDAVPRGAIRIRHVEAGELMQYTAAERVTFLQDSTVTPARAEWLDRAHLPERAWCASDGDDIVGTLRSLPRKLSVPAGPVGTADVAVDALTGVTVAATHRRRGLLRAMITESLAAARDRGDPLTALIAARWPIYGRFGYAPAAQLADGRLDRRRPGAILHTPSGGGLRRVDVAQLRQVAPAVFARARTARAGQLDRTAADWKRALDPAQQPADVAPPIAIVHEGPDGIDGFLRWRPSTDFALQHGGTVTVEELFATDQDSYSALWGYLLALDVVDEVRFQARPLDEPLPWLLEDGRTWQLTSVIDAIWLRLLDVAGALRGRGYAAADRLVLEVVDDAPGGYANGRFLIDAGPDGVDCRPAPELGADLALSQRALAAVYLGQPSLRTQQSAGLVDELTVGALARADAMFATPLLPWMGTAF